MLKKVIWMKCPECENDMLMETCELDSGHIYFYCENEECEAYKEKREYLIYLGDIDLDLW